MTKNSLTSETELLFPVLLKDVRHCGTYLNKLIKERMYVIIIIIIIHINIFTKIMSLIVCHFINSVKSIISAFTCK